MLRYGDSNRDYGFGLYGGLDAAQWCCQPAGETSFQKPGALSAGYARQVPAGPTFVKPLNLGAGYARQVPEGPTFTKQDPLPAEDCEGSE